MAIVLSFRGTNSGLQLKAEFLTSNGVVPMGSGEVAWYFYNAFSKVWGNDAKGVKGLERAFKDQIKKHPKYNIWITGHSLGGAMASLAAYHIANTYNKISEGINKRIRLVTFGEPRSGNAAYAEDFNKKIDYAFRLVNNRDPVPHIPFSLRLPFSSKPGYFTHHKYEVWFPNGMGTLSNWNTCLGEAESNTKCSNHLWIKGNPFDHTWYFDKKVSAYGNNTCVD